MVIRVVLPPCMPDSLRPQYPLASRARLRAGEVDKSLRFGWREDISQYKPWLRVHTDQISLARYHTFRLCRGWKVRALDCEY